MHYKNIFDEAQTNTSLCERELKKTEVGEKREKFDLSVRFSVGNKTAHKRETRVLKGTTRKKSTLEDLDGL